MSVPDIVGTWYPSGYYGHFRSRTRNDILQDYRHAASPTPPSKFYNRVRKSPNKHLFSNHDNRHSFPTDASYFDTGLGRRKANRSVTAFNPELIAWMPHKDEIAKAGSVVSLYRVDFQGGNKKECIPQRLSPRIRKRMATMETVDAKLKWITDYKRQYSHGQPNPRINTDFCTGLEYTNGDQNRRSHQVLNTTGRLPTSIPAYADHTRKRTKSAPMRYSVGDCLVWNSGAPKVQPLYRQKQQRIVLQHSTENKEDNRQNVEQPKISMTPAATTITTFNPVEVDHGKLPTITKTEVLVQ
ncbi:uncharacterized protein LOC100175394 [Ciona intestinalis]